MVLHHLAEALLDLGQHREAETLARESVDLYRAHPEWAAGEHSHAIHVLASIRERTGGINDAIDLRRELVEFNRRALPQGDQRTAASLRPLGLLLTQTGRHAEAEPILRECLSLRETYLPADSPEYWLLSQTRSVLGEAILGQAEVQVTTDRAVAMARLIEAEPLITAAYEWLSSNVDRINPSWRTQRVREAGERVIRLYEAWHAIEPGAGYADKAAEWRSRLETDVPPHDTPIGGPSP